MSKKRNHKKVITRRKLKQKNISKNLTNSLEPTEAQKHKIIEEYAENSGLKVMPSLMEALERQDIASSSEYLSAKEKFLNWFSSYVEDSVLKSGTANYLPSLVTTFIIPLDFRLPLPEEYISGALWGLDRVSGLSFVTAFSKILPIGDAGIKVTYLLVSLCDNETARLMNANNRVSIEKAFEKAINVANSVIAGLQTLPGFHDHNMHDLTALSSNTILKWFTFNRDTKNFSEVQVSEDLDKTFVNIITSMPVKSEKLERFKINHVWKTFTNDKVFKLISLFNSAVNSRCFGRDDQAIIDADTFVEYSLGYIYCEIRISNGDDEKEVIEHFKSITKPGIRAIWGELAPLLGFNNGDELKNKVGFEKYNIYCRLKRNHLHHHFMTDNYGEMDSMFAVFFSGEMIRRTCEIVIESQLKKESLIIAKMTALAESTLFFKELTEECAKAHPGLKLLIS